MQKPPRGILPNPPLWGEFAVQWEDEEEFERAAEQEEAQRMAQEEAGRGGKNDGPMEEQKKMAECGNAECGAGTAGTEQTRL